jgi:hypothetical protein
MMKSTPFRLPCRGIAYNGVQGVQNSSGEVEKNPLSDAAERLKGGEMKRVFVI